MCLTILTFCLSCNVIIQQKFTRSSNKLNKREVPTCAKLPEEKRFKNEIETSEKSNKIMSAEEVKGGEIAEVSDAMAFLDMVFVLEAEKIYNDIVEAYPVAMGKAASKKERDDLGLQKTATLVYGELDFKTLGIAIQKIQKIYGKPDVGSSGPMGILQSKGGQFYDLGSGTG